MSDSLTPYLVSVFSWIELVQALIYFIQEGHDDHCLLLDNVKKSDDDNIGLVSMRFDLKNKQLIDS